MRAYRDRGFESGFLQRRVSCEPDFLPLNSRYFRPVRRKETRARRWDLQFESTSLQRGVAGEPEDDIDIPVRRVSTITIRSRSTTSRRDSRVAERLSRSQ